MKAGFILLIILIVFQFTSGRAQSLGCVEAECGVVSNSFYDFQNYHGIAHGGGYSLHHNGKTILSDYQSYGDYYQGKILKFINDTTGFFLVTSLMDNKVYKIIGDEATQIFSRYGYYSRTLFIVNDNCAYLETSNSVFTDISRCSDIQLSKTLIDDYNGKSDITVYDTIIGKPLCDSLPELNYLFYNGSDTLDYKIKFYVKESALSEIENRAFDWKIYPIPFFTKTTIQAKKSFQNVTLIVRNCMGQTVKQIDKLAGQEITFYRDNLPSGMYFLQLKEKNETYTFKLIISDK